MPSPFPGMDPYLESPELWRGVHARLITYASEAIQEQLRGTPYFADIEERTWITEAERRIYPDVAIARQPSPPKQATESTLQADEPVLVHVWPEEFREGFVQIYESAGHRLVTSIEFVSPTNKSKNQGRRLYLRKQHELSLGGVNLVEVDLLRRGKHVLKVPSALVQPLRPWDYLVSIWRPTQTDFEVYPMALRSPLPRIRIPLKPGDSDTVLDLQSLINRAYDAGPYTARIEYGNPPEVPLTAEDQDWASARIAAWQAAHSAS
jgi:hypothetical protein